MSPGAKAANQRSPVSPSSQPALESLPGSGTGLEQPMGSTAPACKGCEGV